MYTLKCLLFLLFGNHQPIHPTLSLSEASSILGEPAILFSHQDSTGTDGYFRSRQTYKAVTPPINPDQERFLYFSFEQYQNTDLANKLFDSYILSNQDLQGYEALKGLGDEGFYQTDKQNFSLFISRKGKYMIRLKVNKLSVKTNLELFKRIAIKLTTEL